MVRNAVSISRRPSRSFLATQDNRDTRATRSVSPIAFFFVSVVSFLLGVFANTLAEFQYQSSISTFSTSPPHRPTSLFPNATNTFAVNDSGTVAQVPPTSARRPVSAVDDVPPTQMQARSEEQEEGMEPRGLTRFLQSYNNPRQFSVMRTGVEELELAVEEIMQRDGKLPRVVVSFTSLPHRFLKYGRSLITVLKTQTYTPDMIYVIIPQQSRRSNNSFYISDWIANDSLITVLRPAVDYGPASKLIPALEAERDAGFNTTRVITIDDDNEGGWAEESLLELFAYSLVFEDAAIGLVGWNTTCMVRDAHCSPQDAGVPERSYSGTWYNHIRGADDYACHTLSDWLPSYYPSCLGAIRKNFVGFVDVLEGYKGVVYQPRFFDIDDLKQVLNTTYTEGLFLLADDVWFSGWLGVRGVKKLVVNPALNEGEGIQKTLAAMSKQRNLSRELAVLSERDRIFEEVETVEIGLHNTGDFERENHDGVEWFEKKGAWEEGLWDRPNGFLYRSERGITEPPNMK